MYGFLYLDVLHIHTAIVRRTNICMASFIWMYCMFICKENKHMYGIQPLFGELHMFIQQL